MAKGLGSGLGALFGDEVMEQSEGGTYVPLSKIEPRADQPRKTFDEEALMELSESIREHGLIQPITVRKLDGGYYQIIAGERRWRAARMAGLREAPVRVLEVSDEEMAELALIENLQREDLNPVEEARGYRALMDNYGLTQEKVSERVGKSRPVIANALRLLGLPEEVLAMVENKELSLSHARAVLELPDEERRVKVARETVKYGLSVRQTTAMVKTLLEGKKEKPKKDPRVGADGVDYMAEVERELTNALGRKVTVKAGAKHGKFEIEYYDNDDFETLYRALLKIKKD